ncbi:MAG: amino acid permease, partial [Acidobacteria bacterium]|nr:amino acid permease [Acidobacteriota bacterium]
MAAPEPQSPELRRSLGLADALAIVIGIVIGGGIFLVPNLVAAELHSPQAILLVWVVAGVVSFFGALACAELGTMLPDTGGQYVFLREAYGSLAGFLYGWTLFTVIQCGTIAAVGVAFAKFLGVFVPWVKTSNVLFQLGSWQFSSVQL